MQPGSGVQRPAPETSDPAHAGRAHPSRSQPPTTTPTTSSTTSPTSAPTTSHTWHRPHLLTLRELTADELRTLLSRTHEEATRLDARPTGTPTGTEPQPLAGRTLATLFFEDSTRTRASFTLAAQRLGMRTIDLSGPGTSITKGESLTDTARTVEAMGVDAIVVRARAAGAPAAIARALSASVINAGDGRHEHPTQGLLDLYTLARAFDLTVGTTPFDLTGRRVAIVGDAANSRVARSTTAGLRTLGADVTLVGPPGLVSRPLAAALNAEASHDLDATLPHVDAVVMLRIQFERHADRGTIASRREYRARYALTSARLAALQSHAVILHPGPMNRGTEIDHDAAEHPRCLALKQVANGIPARMATLRACLDANQTPV